MLAPEPSTETVLEVPEVPESPKVILPKVELNNPEGTALVPSDFMISFAAAVFVNPESVWVECV